MEKSLRVGICVTAQRSYPLPEGVIWAPIPLAVDIAEGLKVKGHKVTYYGAKTSKMNVPVKSGKLIDGIADPVFRARMSKQRELQPLENMFPMLFDQHLLMQMINDANAGKLDIIHSHSEAMIPLAHLSKVPVLITIHSPYNPYTVELLRIHKGGNFKLVSLSMAQREPMKGLTSMFAANIPNGINLEMFPYSEQSSERFLFAGRLLAQKGVEDAINATKIARQKLDIVGRHYSKSYLAQLKKSESSRIKFLGNVDRSDIHKHYGDAKAVLFPTKWNEPFGLVMTEAMACGAPVIAYDNGAVSEVVKDGVTGFIVKTEKQMAAAMKKIDRIDRASCRAHVEKNFSNAKMIERHEKLYRKLVQK